MQNSYLVSERVNFWRLKNRIKKIRQIINIFFQYSTIAIDWTGFQIIDRMTLIWFILSSCLAFCGFELALIDSATSSLKRAAAQYTVYREMLWYCQLCQHVRWRIRNYSKSFESRFSSTLLSRRDINRKSFDPEVLHVALDLLDTQCFPLDEITPNPASLSYPC